MGKKSLTATIVGIIGGVVFGFALGFHNGLIYTLNISTDIIGDLVGSQNIRLGGVVGSGFATEVIKSMGNTNLKIVSGLDLSP